MNNKDFKNKIKEFRDLPKEVKKILDLTSEVNSEIIEKHSLADKTIVFMGLILDVVLQKVSLGGLLPEIQQRLSLDIQKAKAVVLDLLGLKFLPLGFYLEEVKKYTKELEVDLKQYRNRLEEIFSLQNQVKNRLLSYSLEKIEFQNFNEDNKRKIINLIISRIRGLRKKEKIEEILVREISRGGLGVEKSRAALISEEIERIVIEELIIKEDLERMEERRERVLKIFKELQEGIKGEEGKGDVWKLEKKLAEKKEEEHIEISKKPILSESKEMIKKEKSIRQIEKLISLVPEPTLKSLTPLEKKVLEEEEKSGKIEIDSSDL